MAIKTSSKFEWKRRLSADSMKSFFSPLCFYFGRSFISHSTDRPFFYSISTEFDWNGPRAERGKSGIRMVHTIFDSRSVSLCALSRLRVLIGVSLLKTLKVKNNWTKIDKSSKVARQSCGERSKLKNENWIQTKLSWRAFVSFKPTSIGFGVALRLHRYNFIFQVNHYLLLFSISS